MASRSWKDQPSTTLLQVQLIKEEIGILELRKAARIGYERGRVVNPGGYNGVIDRNIANLQAALKYSDLTLKKEHR